MKKLMSVFVLAMIVSFFSATAQAAPTCVFMKFTDDTRFSRTEAAVSLSDMILEKLIESGEFSFKESDVIDPDIEELLYKGRTIEFQNAEMAAYSNNLDLLFEGSGYSEETALDIATARLGQVIMPSIISEIGRQYGADYLIQGTIRGMGTGDWVDTRLDEMINLFNNIAQYSGTALAGFSFNQNVTKFGVQADIKIIKADTGKVVWQKVVTGKKTKKQSNITLPGFSFLPIKLGSDKLDNEMYNEAMEDAVNKISATLIEAAKKGELFI